MAIPLSLLIPIRIACVVTCQAVGVERRVLHKLQAVPVRQTGVRALVGVTLAQRGGAYADGDHRHGVDFPKLVVCRCTFGLV